MMPAWNSYLHLLFICLLFQKLHRFVLVLHEDNNMNLSLRNILTYNSLLIVHLLHFTIQQI